ncbi:MAG: hypothetical protein ACYTFO_01215 [Planctomycetota bacterium]|jgi:chemotaxis protein histidine kinase CheA
MKDAKKYEKKIKKLLTGLKTVRVRKAADDPIRLLVLSVIEADAPRQQAAKAMAILDKEFVDFNELRVAQPRELVEILGKNYPRARARALELTEALNGIYRRASDVSLDYAADLSKRDLRRHLHELGLTHYAAARLVLFAFDGHAIPVDRDLLETLLMDEYVPDGASIEDVQGFLERIVSQKDAPAAFEVLRRHVEKRFDALTKKRKAEEAARLEAERKAAAEAKAKAEAEERKRRKAEEAAAKKAELAAKKEAEKAAAKKAKEAAKKKAEKAKQAAAKKAKKAAKKAKKKAKAKKPAAKKAKATKAKPKKAKAKKPAAKKAKAAKSKTAKPKKPVKKAKKSAKPKKSVAKKVKKAKKK